MLQAAVTGSAANGANGAATNGGLGCNVGRLSGRSMAQFAQIKKGADYDQVAANVLAQVRDCQNWLS